MPFIDGADAILGDCFGYPEANALKNNWRGLVSPANAQPGMLFSDEDDDKLYHAIGGSGGWEEVLQESLSADKTPIFDNLILDVDASDVSDPPTDGELDAIFPTHPDGFIGFVQDTTSAGSLWLVVYNGGWWYVEMALAV